jgi:hypothetical protein
LNGVRAAKRGKVASLHFGDVEKPADIAKRVADVRFDPKRT